MSQTIEKIQTVYYCASTFHFLFISEDIWIPTKISRYNLSFTCFSWFHGRSRINYISTFKFCTTYSLCKNLSFSHVNQSSASWQLRNQWTTGVSHLAGNFFYLNLTVWIHTTNILVVRYTTFHCLFLSCKESLHSMQFFCSYYYCIGIVVNIENSMLNSSIVLTIPNHFYHTI